jgi:Luciferase-like monooxygenase/Dimerisation domain
MPSKRSSSSPSALDIYRNLLSFAWSGLAMAAAIELDVFSHIAGRKNTTQQVAAAANASENGMRRLLDALCGMGYLRRTGRNYTLQRGAADYLVRGKPLYMGDTAFIGKVMMGGWTMLADAVRKGHAPQGDRSVEKREAFFSKLVPAIFPGSFLAASAVVKRLPAASRRRMVASHQSRLGAFMRPVSIHTAWWRYPGAFPDANFNFEHLKRFAQTLERGRFDTFFMADHLAVLNMPTAALKRSATTTSFDPLTLLPALAMVTERLGLIATASTTYNEPYHIARKFASLDHISGGRAGWNLVTSGNHTRR